MDKLFRKCAICGCDCGTVHGEIKMELPQGVSIPKSYRIVTCVKCGFAYADVNAKQEDYNHYYANNNNYSVNIVASHNDYNKVQNERCNFFETYVLDKQLRVLDIGGGDGELLNTMKKRGFKHVFGIDPSVESIERLKTLGIEGWTKNAFDIVPKELEHSFDVVCFTEVLEHIYDLNLYLEQVSMYLVEEHGMVYVEVPAVEGMAKACMPLPSNFNQEHINYFSLISLDNIFKKHGFVRINSDESCHVSLWNGALTLNAIYKKTNEKLDFEKDTIAAKVIDEYLQMVHVQEKEKEDKLLPIIENNKKVVIWGAGAFAMQLLGKYPMLNEKVAFFVDKNDMKIGKKMCDKEIFLPQKLVEEDVAYPILICANVHADDIEKEIKEMQLQNEYIKI